MAAHLLPLDGGAGGGGVAGGAQLELLAQPGVRQVGVRREVELDLVAGLYVLELLHLELAQVLQRVLLVLLDDRRDLRVVGAGEERLLPAGG